MFIILGVFLIHYILQVLCYSIFKMICCVHSRLFKALLACKYSPLVSVHPDLGISSPKQCTAIKQSII